MKRLYTLLKICVYSKSELKKLIITSPWLGVPLASLVGSVKLEGTYCFPNIEMMKEPVEREINYVFKQVKENIFREVSFSVT